MAAVATPRKARPKATRGVGVSSLAWAKASTLAAALAKAVAASGFAVVVVPVA